MVTGLRRILTAMLLGVFVSLGVIAALVIGRRPGTRRAAPVPAPDRTAPVEARHGGRGFAFARLALILMAGLAATLYGAGGWLWDRAQPSESGPDRTALSPPAAGGASDRHPDPHAAAPAGSIPDTEPGGPALAETGAGTGPRFEVVRVAPNGEAVVAGRAGPSAAVELIVDGRPVAQTISGPDGQFTLTLALPTGSSEIGLRMTDARGHVRRAPASVSVTVAPTRDAMPLVALMQPDAPTVAPSRPGPSRPAAASPLPAPAPAPASRDDSDRAARQDPDGAASRGRETAGGSGADATKEAGPAEAGRDGGANPAGGAAPAAATAPRADPQPADRPAVAAEPAPTKIARVEAGSGGRLSVTAQAAPGANVRLYLNETLIAPATVGRDGTVTVSIGRGVRPGAYRIRIDQVDAVTGKVRDRAEVPFSAPEPAQNGVDDAAPQGTGTGTGTGTSAAGSTAAPPGRPAGPADSPAAAAALPAGGTPGMAAGASEVHVPGIETARIVRGDSLWKISRRTYGGGDRYTVIYDANQDQIRDPNRIYPGQIFVLPSEGAAGTAPPGETRE